MLGGLYIYIDLQHVVRSVILGLLSTLVPEDVHVCFSNLVLAVTQSCLLHVVQMTIKTVDATVTPFHLFDTFS